VPLVLLLLACGLAANVLLGPLGLGLLQWRVSANGLNQTYGADAAALALVVPAALAAAGLWRRAHRLAAPLALGVGLATLYYAVAETLGGDYLRYAGNNERFSLLFLGPWTARPRRRRAGWPAARPPSSRSRARSSAPPGCGNSWASPSPAPPGRSTWTPRAPSGRSASSTWGSSSRPRCGRPRACGAGAPRR